MQGGLLVSVASTGQSASASRRQAQATATGPALRARRGCPPLHLTPSPGSAHSALRPAWNSFGSSFCRMEIPLQHFFSPSITDTQLTYRAVHTRGTRSSNSVLARTVKRSPHSEWLAPVTLTAPTLLLVTRTPKTYEQLATPSAVP